MTEITYIEVDETHRIEVMPSGNHYPQSLVNPAWRYFTEGWSYYRKGGNRQHRFKTEQGARKFLASK